MVRWVSTYPGELFKLSDFNSVSVSLDQYRAFTDHVMSYVLDEKAMTVVYSGLSIFHVVRVHFQPISLIGKSSRKNVSPSLSNQLFHRKSRF